MQHYHRIGYFLVFNFVFLFPVSAQAQIIPDSSLENSNSVVVPNQVINNTSSDIITGGSSQGNTLFHSFQEFNVKDNQGAYFSNPSGITNILSRVTGSNPSNILGKLGVLGNANLFFINPNGIIFGGNASLDLSGSFLASTANSIKLSDGNEFSATKPQAAPLLTVSVPVGLGFIGNPGSIEVQGVGHTLSTSTTTNFIEGAGGSATGLRVQSGRNLALVRGNIIFNGGIVTAPAGKIEITGIDVGQVTINSIFDNWIFDYSLVQDFQDIQITNLSLLDTSGFDNGIISLQGDRITIADNSYALIQSQNSKVGGNINVNALQSLSIIGNTFNLNTIDPFQAVRNRTGIVSESFSGQGANINISTKDLLLQFAGGVASNSLFSGFGGNITINASNSIQVIGASPIDPLNSFSVIATNASGFSNSGNITLLTNNLLIEDGGSIFSGTFGAGSSGNININSLGSVLVKGSRNFAASASIRNVTASGSAPSTVTSSSYGSGDAGDLVIDTPQLTVLDGASISTSTVASGTAGNVIITAPDFVKVSGFLEAKGAGQQTIFPSLIASSGIILDPLLQQLLGLPNVPSGNAGNVFITTKDLMLDNYAQLTVRNDGLGKAGTLEINANSVRLENKAGITASTESGQGGNIKINSDDWLLMRRNSRISTNAGNAQAGGDGGQINIDTTFLVAPPLENNDITANAFIGEGGRIQISASAIFGFVPRSREELQTLLRTGNPNELDPSRLPSSDITAISQTNPSLSGDLTIITPNIDPNNGLVNLPVEITDLSNSIGQECANTVGPEANKFIITGRGGLPEDPTKPLNGQTIWTDSRLFLTTEEKPTSPPAPTKQPTDSTAIPLNEASLVEINSEGEAVLTAATPSSSLQVPWISPSCHAS